MLVWGTFSPHQPFFSKGKSLQKSLIGLSPCSTFLSEMLTHSLPLHHPSQPTSWLRACCYSAHTDGSWIFVSSIVESLFLLSHHCAKNPLWGSWGVEIHTETPCTAQRKHCLTFKTALVHLFPKVELWLNNFSEKKKKVTLI